MDSGHRGKRRWIVAGVVAMLLICIVAPFAWARHRDDEAVSSLRHDIYAAAPTGASIRWADVGVGSFGSGDNVQCDRGFVVHLATEMPAAAVERVYRARLAGRFDTLFAQSTPDGVTVEGHRSLSDRFEIRCW